MIWGHPRLIVHRCGGALAPENTLAGLRKAAELGCRAVEFDVMLSADGTPVLIHPPGTRCTAPSTSSTLSRSSSRVRRMSTSASRAGVESGPPAPARAVSTASAWSSRGIEAEAK